MRFVYVDKWFLLWLSLHHRSNTILAIYQESVSQLLVIGKGSIFNYIVYILYVLLLHLLTSSEKKGKEALPFIYTIIVA